MTIISTHVNNKDKTSTLIQGSGFIYTGEPWFDAKDVARVLVYNCLQKAIRDPADEEDELTERIVPSGQHGEVAFINESRLCYLIFSAKIRTPQDDNGSLALLSRMQQGGLDISIPRMLLRHK